ncbi:MAG: hypothetical protein DRN99_08820 [Thermoproteota archaeon]|nr:MAG: hypothetical protein DRN99_08820 [Candidatus Korarchaeota archaeon]
MLAAEARSLAKKFGRTVAVRDATFTVEEGEAAALVGPNGAGKTTTLKLMLGLLKPDKGSLRVLGLDPWRNGREVRMQVGVLHEKPVFPEWAKVESILSYVASLKKLDKTHIDRALRLSGLEPYRSSKVKHLSRGYLQRLGVAAAILGEPKLLLLDEPTANLDPLARAEIIQLRKVLKEELDTTMIISSHILPELEQICDSLVIISRGVTICSGRVSELATKYAASILYEVKTADPRALASQLIRIRGVKLVEVVGSSQLRVKVAPEAKAKLLSLLENSNLATEVKAKSADLYSLYELALAEH